MRRLRVKPAQSQRRLDLVVSDWLALSRSQAARAIKLGEITLNGLAAKAREIIKAGDQIEYRPPAASAQPISVPIVYEDDDMLVVDKPAGLLVHPTSHGNQATLVDFARQRSADPDPTRPGIVHRLDKDTSGLIIIAKTAAAKTYLQRRFADRKVDKEYLVLVEGSLPRSRAEINLPIGAGVGLRRRVDPGGRRALTHYEVIKRYPESTYLQAHPASGRTHQLRVHFAAIGHAIVGDELYGRAEPRLGRQFLHAHKLAFTAPGGQWLELTSPLPQALKDYLDSLE